VGVSHLRQGGYGLAHSIWRANSRIFLSMSLIDILSLPTRKSATVRTRGPYRRRSSHEPAGTCISKIFYFSTRLDSTLANLLL
jgi:hypothetical protein